MAIFQTLGKMGTTHNNTNMFSPAAVDYMATKKEYNQKRVCKPGQRTLTCYWRQISRQQKPLKNRRFETKPFHHLIQKTRKTNKRTIKEVESTSPTTPI